MAEQQNRVAPPFPTPPPFYTHFTKQNISQLQQLRKEASEHEPKAALDLLSLPPEIRYLVPPAPPAEDHYRTFGAAINLHAPDASLGDANIEQLYPADPAATLHPQPHLIALSRSLLTTFLSLVGIMSQDPTGFYEERVQSLQTIMFNIHDLINRYRPHQARESLALMMEDRLVSMKDEIRRIEDAKAGVEQIMAGLVQAGESQNAERQGGDGGPVGVDTGGPLRMVSDKGAMEKQRSAWAAIDNETAGSW